MKKLTIETVCDPKCCLMEGPLWHQLEKKLYFTDIEEQQLWVCDPSTGNPELLWAGDYHVGGFVFNHKDEIILFADNYVFKYLRANGMIETLFALDFQEGERFNDVTTDPEGRVFAGTTQQDGKPGKLYRFETGKEPVVVLEDVFCSNGMTFTMDEKSFFHTNTGALTITKYDYDRKTGEIDQGKVFYQGEKSMGLPDGLTLDTDDCLWSAFWDAGEVRRFSPTGEIIQNIELPAQRPTSVIFGGSCLDELYITTASVGRVDAKTCVNDQGEYLGGCLYRVKPGVVGRPEWKTSLC